MKKVALILSLLFMINPIVKAETKIMYSLDGSLSKEYIGQDLIYSGNYFFSFYEDDIYSGYAVIPVNTDQIKIANSNEDFMYLVKNACDKLLPKIEITKSGILNDPVKYSSYWLNETLNTYPMLQVEGFRVSYEYSNGNTLITVYFDYYIEDYDLLIEYETNIYNFLFESDYTGLNRDELQYDIYNFILDKASYDSGELKNTVQNLLVNGKANCEGYSKALMFLNNTHGIPTKVITGITNSGGLHMWNMTITDEIKYHDVTFEDTSIYDFYNLENSPHEIKEFY